LKKILLSIDFDGTLLNSDAVISDFSKCILKRFIIQHQKSYILFNSGRPQEQMEKFLKQILYNQKKEYKQSFFAASDNGCLLMNSDLHIIYKYVINDKEVKYLWNEAIKEKLNPFAHFDGIIYYARKSEKIKLLLDRHNADMDYRHAHLEIKSLDNLNIKTDLPKFTLVVAKDENKKRALNFIKKHAKRLNTSYITAENSFFMIMANNKTKADPINFLIKEKLIKKEDVYVFGDSHNDIPSFTLTNNIIVPSSAPLNIQEYATEVCDSASNDGVAKYIEKTFFNI